MGKHGGQLLWPEGPDVHYLQESPSPQCHWQVLGSLSQDYSPEETWWLSGPGRQPTLPVPVHILHVGAGMYACCCDLSPALGCSRGYSGGVVAL